MSFYLITGSVNLDHLGRVLLSASFSIVVTGLPVVIPKYSVGRDVGSVLLLLALRPTGFSIRFLPEAIVVLHWSRLRLLGPPGPLQER